MVNRDVLLRMEASKRITAADVQALRAVLYRDGTIDGTEVEQLFRWNEIAAAQDPSWHALFIEALSEYLVDRTQPRGYIDPAKADWLIARISVDGVVNSTTELELLVRVLEKATASPERLCAFALEQVKRAVVEGQGPLAGGGRLEPGRVGPDEVELLRRILYAFGGEGNVAITRAEAEILFDINDATAHADNDPAWAELFVRAIASFTLAASGYVPPSRQEALRREAWLDEASGGVVDVLSRMVAGGLRGALQASRQSEGESAWAERNAHFEAETAAAESVTASEAEWLAARIGRDGSLHANEKALLRSLRRRRETFTRPCGR